MTDTERFEIIIGALGELVIALGSIGLYEKDIVLIGAQVVALEQRARKLELFEVRTPHDIALTRGFSMEPDLVFDTDDEQKMEQLFEVTRQQGFVRSFLPGRPARYVKTVRGVKVEVDFFTTSIEEPSPGGLPRLRGAGRLRTHSVALLHNQTISVPDACSYLSMKLEAKLRIRPAHQKDSFDMYLYVRTMGEQAVIKSLDNTGPDGARVRRELQELFGSLDGRGVRDVVAAGLPQANPAEKELLLRHVVETFEPIFVHRPR